MPRQLPCSIALHNGPTGSGKTRRLVHAVAQWLQGTAPGTAMVASDQLLVLCSNHARQHAFQQQLLAALMAPSADGHMAGFGQLPVYTFSGFVRQMLTDCWPFAEQLLIKHSNPEEGVSPQILPTLCGFEVTEQLLRQLIAGQEVQAPGLFSEFPGNESALIKQLIRRHRLRAECHIDRATIAQRDSLLMVPCQGAIAAIETQLDATTARLRMLDPARQLGLFATLLQHEPRFAEQVAQRCQAVVVDDVDETHPAQQQFVDWVLDRAITAILAGDADGGARQGYLNAYPQGWHALLAAHPEAVTSHTVPHTGYQRAVAIGQGWQASLPSDTSVAGIAPIRTYPTRWEMLAAAMTQVSHHIAGGGQPGDVAILLPRLDELTAYGLTHAARQQGIPLQCLSGGATPMTDPLARSLLYALQVLYRPQWQRPLTITEWQLLWFAVHPNTLPYRQAVVACLAPLAVGGMLANHPQPLPPWEMLASQLASTAWAKAPDVATRAIQQGYHQLLSVFTRCHNKTPSQSAYALWQSMLSPQVWPRQPVPAVEQLFRSLHHTLTLHQRLAALHGQTAPEDTETAYHWLLQVKQGIVAETPSMPPAINANAVVVATPQKWVDMNQARPHALWLDVTSPEWARTDDAPLYHAWVHGAQTEADAEAYGQLPPETLRIRRAAHVTRNLALLATETLTPYASQLDDTGQDTPTITLGTLAGVLQPLAGQPVETPVVTAQRAILRDDQKPVLDYRGGTMAISAVPGAGKTFVNVELICELASRGVNPADILVLTYMESAARTLQGRLQTKLQTAQLPTVSTIHGLAFKMLTENEHFRRFPELGDTLVVMDDYAQEQRLSKITHSLHGRHLQGHRINANSFHKLVRRCINDAKYYRLSPQAVADGLDNPATDTAAAANPLYRWCARAYYQYQQQCRQAGEIDFTDLIVYATRLLEDAPEVRAYYQQQYPWVIEDEAQDSSTLLQQFISLLGGDTPNLIRTGDTNQSITTTFSAADPEVFRTFARTADKSVLMDRSGRCAEPVMDLANAWLRHCLDVPQLSDAFTAVRMKPVADRNPALLWPIQALTFATEIDEQAYWMETIAQWRNQYPKASIAVLVSANREAVTLAKALQQAGIPAVCFSDGFQTNAVFGVIRAVMHCIVHPFSKPAQQQLVEAMTDSGVLFQPPFVDEDNWQPALDAELAWLGKHLLLAGPAGDIPHAVVQRLAFDMQEFCQLATTESLPTLVATIACRYFTDAIARSNGLLCAMESRRFLQRLTEEVGPQQASSHAPIELLLQHMDRLYQGRSVRRVFNDALNEQDEQVVQVMTLHKSKGQEFDMVVMPRLIEGYQTRGGLKPEDELALRIRQLAQQGSAVVNTAVPNDQLAEQFTRQQLGERARLMYVGITRAKRALVCSTVGQVVRFGNKLEKANPSDFYQFIEHYVANPSPAGLDDAERLSALLGDDTAEVCV